MLRLIHDDAIEWLSEKEGLQINHWGAAEKTFRISGKIPDLVGSKGEIHEVETVGLKKSKIESYTKLNCPRNLWLVFEANPLMAFDHLRLLFKDTEGFQEIIKPAKLIRKKVSDALSQIEEVNKNLLQLLDKQRSVKQNIGELEKKKQSIEVQIESLVRDKQFYVEQKIDQGKLVVMRVSATTFKNCLPNKVEVIGEQEGVKK